MILKNSVLILTLMTVASGCASAKRAPLHVYQSPLLASAAENPRPADREFDPSAPGDWNAGGETVVAQSEDSTTRAKREAVAERRAARKAKRADRAKRNRGKALPLSVGTSMGGYDGATQSGSADGYIPALAAAYVHKTFEVNGVALPDVARTSIPKLWDACRTNKGTSVEQPKPGDAVFFHNVFDSNSDGRNNDWYTHAAIVESVAADGTATVLSWRGGEVSRVTVNPSKADDLAANSQLREPSADDAPFTQYHAGQLFAGWCSLLDGKRDVVVMDAWAPEI